MTQAKKYRGSFSNYVFLIIVIATFFFFAITQNNFLKIGNIMDILRQGSIYFIMLAGANWVFAAGEMECSFPDIAACASAWMAVMFARGIQLDVAILLCIGICCGYGLLSGFLVTRFNLPAIIVTIAVSSIARSFGLLATGGKNVTLKVGNAPSVFYWIVNQKVGEIPVLVFAGIGLVIVLWFLQERKRFGQYIYALADNKKAAENAGIKTGKILLIAFVLGAGFAALGGCLIGVNTTSGRPFMGSLLFLDSFTKVFLGAMVIKLGKVNIIGTFIGCIFMNLITSGLTFMGAASFVQSVITGLLLILGVAISSLAENRRKLRSQMEG